MCLQKLHFFATFKLHQNLIQALEQYPPETPYLIQKAAKISRKINSENSQKQYSSSLYQSLSLLSTMLTKAQLETDKKIKLGLFEQIHEFFDLDKKKRKNLNQNQNQNLSNLNIQVDIPKEFFFLEFGKFLIQIGSKKQGVLNILKCLKKKIKKFQISHPQTLKIVDILTTVNENFSQFYKNQEYILQSILIKQKQMNDSNELLIKSYKNLGLYWWSKGCNRLFSQYQENALESYEQGINIIEQKQKFKIQMLELIHKIFYILALQQNYKDLNEYIEEIDSNIVYLFGQQSLEYTQYQIKKSEILILQERWDEALKIVKEIQNNNKNNYYIYSISKIKEAVIYSENNYSYKNYAEAHKCLTKALKLSEDNNNVQLMKEIYLKFSHFYQNKNNQKDLNYETAVDYIQKNIEISQTIEEQADRKFDLSKIYIEQQQYDQAQSLLKEVCEVYYQIYQDNHWKFEQVFDILAEILLELELYQPSLKKADQSLKLKIKNHGYHSIQVVEQYMNNANLQIKYIEKIKDQQNPSQIKLNPIVTNFDNPSLFSTSDKNKFSPTQASSPLQFSLVRTKEPNFDFSELRKTSNPNYTFNNNNNINNVNRSRTRLNSCETSNISNLKLQYLEKSTMNQKNQNICKILNQANNELLQGWNILFKLTNLDPKIKQQEINQILDIQKKLYQLENQLLVVNNNEHSNQKHQKCLTDLVSGEEVPVLPISQNPSVNRSRAKSKVFQNQGNDSTCIIF
ncbi:hypothetical protein PPERSA_10790 [Pseudocohnilembus persalinus]|uniref:Tetratricopeptide repeat protein n=1 Tax=Pseudocohnilembus persalinus TaxID=266149 RepID=A0A0V0QDK6_PSEPJ|nr:hypothetical protein PPERSA_10790 [Pseudocohnilembus persalinus]|eukprot:KRX00291.1 hypothetical protein PPERSA_10790 [Pseudocohnilembus persalinus]